MQVLLFIVISVGALTLVLPANVSDVGSMIALAMKSIQAASPEAPAVPQRA